MKLVFTLLILLIIFVSCTTHQSSQRIKFNIDEKGNKISHSQLQKKWREKNNNLLRWDYIKKDSGRVAKLSNSVYASYQISYAAFNKKLQEITGEDLSHNPTFLLQYTFLNDLCSVSSSNNWNESVIKNRKKFTTPVKDRVEKNYDNILVLYFFESGIYLEDSPTSIKQYYFQDEDNFLRNIIFQQATLCGSLALIKTNGNMLVRNGEYSLDQMAQHLKPENWNLFFEE